MKDAGKYLLVAAQLGLILLAIRLYHIEEVSGFAGIAPWVFAGFLVHAFLPHSWRMPFFLLLSLLSIGLILGPAEGGILVALGLALIGLCHLPLPFVVRTALILLAGAGLIAVRAEWVAVSSEALPTRILPILGAMFMFRLAVYLYDLRNERKPASIWQRLSYFFMVPNVCFPLFPVVDYQAFGRTYYGREAHEIYQKGVAWILRGILQLILYRWIYYYWVPAPTDVVDLFDVALFVVTTYALYLRISGQFHLIVGVLSLFGFDLPETHRSYFLTSSFTDYWRRINIYWKDFMTKMVFYPVFMRSRKLGMTPGLAIATVVVFLGTWLLHSYQWLWIRGEFPLRSADGIFWGGLGLLVLINTLYDAKHPQKGKAAASLRAALVHALKTTGMFVTISLLWSLWSAESPGHWLLIVKQARHSPASHWLALAGVLGALVTLGTTVRYLRHAGARKSIETRTFRASALATTLTALAIILLGLPQVQARLGQRGSAFVASLQDEKLNRNDEELLQRGYYEGLLDEGTLTSGLWQANLGRPRDWKPIYNSPAVRDAPGILEYELIPSNSLWVKRAPFSTNRWGMRDTDYTLEKPPGTYRIALLGSSQVMGAGVLDSETFERLFEDRINRDLAGGAYQKYEILNFAVGGYSVIQNRLLSEQKVPAFHPDALYFVVHRTEKRRLTANLYRAVTGDDHDFGYPFIRKRVRLSGVNKKMLRPEMEQQFEPYFDEIITWSLRGIAASARRMGAEAVLVYGPTLNEDDEGRVFRDRMLAVGREVGFHIVDLSEAYGDMQDPMEMALAPWDDHPDARGHALLAEEMFRKIVEELELLGSGPGADDSL